MAGRAQGLREGLRTVEDKASAPLSITVPLLAQVAARVMPPDTSYVDDTIVHGRAIREAYDVGRAVGFFRAPSGLGTSPSAMIGRPSWRLPQRPCVVTIGDGR